MPITDVLDRNCELYGNENMIQGNIKASPVAIKKLLESFQDE